MRLSLPSLLFVRPPPTVPLPSLTPYTPHKLPCTAPPTSSHLIVHLPSPPPTWPPKIPSLIHPSLPPLLADPLSPSMRVLYAWDGVGEEPWIERPERSLQAKWFVPGKKKWEGELTSNGELPVKETELEGLWCIEGLKKSSVVQGSRQAALDEGWDIYVCVHGSRDCRCGDVGGALVDKLKEERERMGIPSEKVRIWEVSHLGGHKFAANVLLFPSSHLLGNLRPQHASLLLSSLFAEPDSNYPLIPRDLLPFWRGKNGMTKEEMKVFWVAASGTAPPPPQAVEDEPEEEKKGPIEIVFETWEGEEVKTEAMEGETVMELGKRLELGAMEGICGGVLECATCHCFIPSEPSPPPVPPLTDEEEDMLVNAMMPKPTSRLACQIKVTPELGEWCAKGGRIGLPRY